MEWTDRFLRVGMFFTGFYDRHSSRILFTCGFNSFVIENKLIELIFLSLQFPPLCRRMKVQLKDR